MTQNNGFWTDERIERLKRLYHDGLSYSQIAQEFGGQISRCAVIGKASRLGLTGRKRKQVDNRRGRVRSSVAAGANRDSMGQLIGRSKTFYPKPKREKVTRVTNHGNRFDTVEVLAPLPLPMEPNVEIPAGQRCTLLELDSSKCRWPVGDPGSPDFFFCGGRPASGLPYCVYHSCVAYVPPNERRRDRRLLHI